MATGSCCGGMRVGTLAEIDDVEALSVTLLRLWCSGPGSQEEVWNAFALAFGGRQGGAALRSFEKLVALLCGHGHRPLMRQAVGSRDLGADERVFAHLIGAGATCDREQAAVMATLMVRPDVVPMVATLAQEVGVTLRRLSLRPTALPVTTAHGTGQPGLRLRH